VADLVNLPIESLSDPSFATLTSTNFAAGRPTRVQPNATCAYFPKLTFTRTSKPPRSCSLNPSATLPVSAFGTWEYWNSTATADHRFV